MPSVCPWLTTDPLLRVACAAAACVLAAALVVCPPARAAAPKAAERPEELINWYYSAAFGTGFYQSGDRSVAVVQLPLSYRWPTADEARWRLTFKLPVSLGFYDLDLDDIAAGDLPHSVSTLSILPGMQVDVQATPHWQLKPFGYAGFGWELDGRDSAFIYSLGVKNRLTYPLGEKQIMLGATLNHAGYRARGGVHRPLTQLALGLNLAFPTHGTIKGVPADLGLHLIHYVYLTPLDLPTPRNVNNQLRSETEFAVSIGTRSSVPLGVFDRNLVDFDMVGIAFRIGHDVQAIRLFFSLPY
ncbi:MAG: hypothetical protein KIS79_02305 [Burkholderiales bacterium]|nr:hypothetical protein [Burkholderiales bacterium]